MLALCLHDQTTILLPFSNTLLLLSYLKKIYLHCHMYFSCWWVWFLVVFEVNSTRVRLKFIENCMYVSVHSFVENMTHRQSLLLLFSHSLYFHWHCTSVSCCANDAHTTTRQTQIHKQASMTTGIIRGNEIIVFRYF